MCIVPLKVDAKIFPTFLVGVDGGVLFEDRSKMLGIAFLYILDAKIIYYYLKHDRAPFVQPQDGGSVCLIVSRRSESFAEEAVGYFFYLG